MYDTSTDLKKIIIGKPLIRLQLSKANEYIKKYTVYIERECLMMVAVTVIMLMIKMMTPHKIIAEVLLLHCSLSPSSLP